MISLLFVYEFIVSKTLTHSDFVHLTGFISIVQDTKESAKTKTLSHGVYIPGERTLDSVQINKQIESV